MVWGLGFLGVSCLDPVVVAEVLRPKREQGLGFRALGFRALFRALGFRV